jgi:conjugative transposon TraM protein
MEQKNHSAKFLRQRKFFTVLPLLTLPFVTLMFWGLGDGKGNAAVASTNAQHGFNLKLPAAKLKDEKQLNKLSFYQKASLDSAKQKEAEKLDPYWNRGFHDSSGSIFSPGFPGNSLLNDYGLDANKTKVYSKLDELKKALDKSQQAVNYNQQNRHSFSLSSYSHSNDFGKLQTILQKINEDKNEDPEITQLNNMLDKIIAIQNPEQGKGSTIGSVTKDLPVKTKKQKAEVSLLKNENLKTTIANIDSSSGNGFYGVSYNADSNFSNSIEAIVPETQTVVAGATIKLALSNDITISDVLLPIGTLIYGNVSPAGERLKISVSSIRFKNSILPVSLNVYDMDGQEGIYVPGSINRTVAKESANNAMGSMNTTTIDPSLGAQAASASIEAAKSLFTKKVKLIKMTVRAGYKVFLKDNNN